MSLFDDPNADWNRDYYEANGGDPPLTFREWLEEKEQELLASIPPGTARDDPAHEALMGHLAEIQSLLGGREVKAEELEIPF